MNKYQKIVKKFATERNWDQYHNPKDLLLGIVEEVGELRNLVKWEQDIIILRKTLKDNKAEVEDGIGDIFCLLAHLANSAEVDIDKAIEKTLKLQKKRFPVKLMKNQHANLHIGGIDTKYKK